MENIGLRAKDAAKYLGIAESTLWRWTKEGLLKATKIGYRVTVWELLELDRFRLVGRQKSVNV